MVTQKEQYTKKLENSIKKKEMYENKTHKDLTEYKKYGWTDEQIERLRNNRITELEREIKICNINLEKITKKEELKLQKIKDKEIKPENLIPEIEEFLKNWGTRYGNYILNINKNMYNRYLQHRALFNPENPCKATKETNEDYKNMIKEFEKIYGKMAIKLYYYSDMYLKSNNEELLKSEIDKIVTKEINNKRSILYKRVENKIGKITGIEHLDINEIGELEGIIKGENGSGWLRLIWAGGYNIQCLHYRIIFT